MSDVADTGALSPAENAYFESRGETPIASPEPKPEGDAKPNGEAQPKPEGDPADKVEKVVPLAALHEERNRRKDFEKQVRERDIAIARYEERFKLVEEQGKKAAPEPVDRNADPFAYINQVGDKTESIEQKLNRMETQERQRGEQQHVLSLYSNSVSAFKATAPDFDEAYQSAVTSRQRVYELVGHPNPAAAAQADEFQLVTAALQQGKNPAEVIYEIAKAQGWQPKAKEPAKGEAAAKLDTIEKGQAANKSLQSAGGAGGPDEMTAQRLLDMPMDEFEAWTTKNPAKAKRLMGG